MSDRYERLLRAYPMQWREQHGQVVTALQRDADLARGRSAPSLPDRWGFLVRGLVQRGRRSHSLPPSLASFVNGPRLFDQGNGVVPEGTDALDRRGRRVDRSRVHAGLDFNRNAADGAMEPLGWDR